MPEIVVLPGLRHGRRAGRELLEAHVLGIAGQKRVPYRRELAQTVLKHLAGGAGRQEVLLYAHPLHEALRHGAADVIVDRSPLVRMTPTRCAPVCVGLPLIAAELARQGVVGRCSAAPYSLEIRVRQPDQEAGPEVVVAGVCVVEAQAVAALAGEARGGARHQLREARPSAPARLPPHSRACKAQVLSKYHPVLQAAAPLCFYSRRNPEKLQALFAHGAWYTGVTPRKRRLYKSVTKGSNLYFVSFAY